jgi:hypothetical protein
MAFWRRSKGRHALGAAVTSIPAAPPPRAAAAPPAPAPPAFAPPAPAPPAPAPPAPALPAPAPPAPVLEPASAPSVPLDWSFPQLQPAVAAVLPPSGPRVELTFRDGTSTALDPAQAQALDEIAQILTRRD